jgi:hypothetical protein
MTLANAIIIDYPLGAAGGFGGLLLWCSNDQLPARVGFGANGSHLIDADY